MKTKETSTDWGSAPPLSVATKSLAALTLTLCAAGSAAYASTDYGPAIWRPAYSGHWYTSGYGHKFHVCHDMEGYYLNSISFMQRSTTSASVHYCVNGLTDSSDGGAAPGEVSQLVRDSYYAWHVLCWNQYCTGTEHEGFVSNPAWFTEALYTSSAGVTRHLQSIFGWPMDRNHVVGHDAKSSAAWCNYASANFGINAYCNSHTDPGPYWNWSHYMDLCNGASSCVQGAILARYNALGGAAGVMGANTTCELTCPDGFGKYNHFQNGSIYWTSGTGAWEVRGNIHTHWAALGWERGPNGYPTTGENGCPDGVGRYNHFQNGSIYWTPSTGAWSVQGIIHDHWAALGWEAGVCGYPTTDESTCPDKVGKYNHFSKGCSIYYTGATGAQQVGGAIRNLWSSMGWETSSLGYPTTDESPCPDGVGRYNHFQNGSIYWTPSTGAHEVEGAIHTKWSSLSWETGVCGYPTTDQTTCPDGVGKFNHFSKSASIYWSPSTGAFSIYGPIRDKWSAMGWERSSFGYPVSDVYSISGSEVRSDFQHGSIIYNSSTGQYSLLPGPNAPSGLTATALSATQVKLTWTDNSSNETGFKIEQSVGGTASFAPIATVGANVTVFTNSGLSSGTTYYYRVLAYQSNDTNSTWVSTYSNTNSATPMLSPSLSTIPEQSGTETMPLTFTASATNPNQSVTTTTFQDFESFTNYTTDDQFMFRKPLNSGTTSAFIDTTVTNYTKVSTSFPSGHTSAKVLKASVSFKTGTTNPWLRLSTAGTANMPNPTVDLDQVVRFDICVDKAMSVGLGLRETGTSAGFGADGGTTGTIDWDGVSSVTGGMPNPTKSLSANTWTTLSFNIPFEAQAAFTGDGVVSSGIKGVLEHLALVPTGGMGAYNVYLDNFAVVTTNTLTYSLDAGYPTGASIQPKTGAFKWTPASGQAGTYNITVRATDRLGMSDAKTFTVTIAPFSGNHKPVLAPISNKTVNELTPLTFTASGTDQDSGQTLTYTLDAGAPTGASINGSTGAFSWTPTEAQGPGAYTITVRVTDNGTPSTNAAQSFTVTVNEVNTAPVLAAIPNQTINELTTLNLTASATDADIPANTITYSLGINAPAGATINPATGAFSWTPTEAQGPSTNSITITATDNGSPVLSSSQTFIVTVNEVNTAPVLTVNTTSTEIETVTDFESYQNGTYSGTVMFAQPSYSSSTSAFLDTTFTNITSVTNTFPAGHASSQALWASWAFKTSATNPWVRLTTYNVPNLPNPVVRLDQRIRFDVWSDKALGIALGLRETGGNGPVGANGGTTGTIEWAGATGAVGGQPQCAHVVTASNWTTLEFNLPSEAITAFTGNGVLSTGYGVLEHLALVPAGGMGVYNLYLDNFQVVTVKTNLTVDTGSTLTFTATATDADLPAQHLAFSLDAGAPTNAAIDSATGVFTWTPTSAQGPSTNVVSVRVTDDGPGNLSASQNVTIIVNKVNTPPKLTGVPNQAVEIQSGATINFTVSADDADVPTNTLTFSLQGTVPQGASIDPNSGAFSWTPPGNVSSTNAITIRVTDNGVPPMYDEQVAMIYVTATNTAPTLSLGAARMEEFVVNFESFTNNTPNEAVMFKRPYNSGTTTNYIDSTVTNYTTVTTNFPAGHASAKVLKAGWNFKTSATNYWVRLTTANATYVPNPTINASARLKFDIYTTKALKVGLGIRETGTSAENGANGGTTGTIEFVGVTSVISGTPQPTRTVTASNWTTLEFDLPNEPKQAFTGDGILNPGQQVLEHLALVGAGGTGAYTVYFDNFNVVTTSSLPATITMKANSTLTFTASGTDPDPGSGLNFGLDADAPAGATIDMNTGAFTWTPAVGGVTNAMTVFVNDNPTNGAPAKTDSKLITVIVTTDTLGAQSVPGASFVAGGDTVTLAWDAVVGATYKVQYKATGASVWTDAGAPVTATDANCSITVINEGNDATYRVVEISASGASDE